MNNRHTLTKSLHTVTAVSRLADNLMSVGTIRHTADDGSIGATLARANDRIAAVRLALDILGQPSAWNAQDPTFAACVAALAKLRASLVRS